MVKHIANNSIEPYAVRLSSLAKRLREARHLERMSQGDVQRRLEKVIRGLPKEKLTNVDKIVFDGVGTLEDGGSGFVDLRAESMEAISRAYRIHRLMLDPLVARESRTNCIVEKKRSFSRAWATAGITAYGHKAEYKFPARRLAETDELALVWLTLGAGGYSDTHSHGGDEFQLVLNGSVEVRLEDTGLWTRLSQGDFVHFYAEQTHSAWCLPGSKTPAEVLIIRFYPSGSRRQLSEDLSPEPASWSTYLKARIVDEMKAAVGTGQFMRHTRKQIPRPTDTVSDTCALGRLLCSLASEDFRGEGMGLSLSELARLASDSAPNQAATSTFSRSKLDRLHHGQAKILASELDLIARLYEVEPFILYDFLFPAFRQAVVLRGGSEPAAEHSDWCQLPRDYLPADQSRYFVPIRRLADSDVSVAIVELPPFAETPMNRHPGQEIIIPLRGTVRIRFGDGDGYELRQRIHRFAHFESRIVHRISNQTQNFARFIVIRLYQ